MAITYVHQPRGHVYWSSDPVDVHGVMKDVACKVAKANEDGELAAIYWEGVEDTLHELFSATGVDTRIDFMADMGMAFEKRTMTRAWKEVD